MAASIADAEVVNLNGIETLIANGFSTFPIKCNPVFNNCPKSPSKNPPDCTILCNWLFENFILTDEPFEKALQSLQLVH